MKSYIYSLSILAFLFTSCGNPKVELQEKIDTLILGKTQSAETKASIAKFQAQFIEAYPEDSMTKAYLENVAFYYLLVDSTGLAKKYANQYVDEYPTEENVLDIKLIIAKAELKDHNYKEAIDRFENVQNEKMLRISDMRLLADAHYALLSDTTAEDADLHYYKYASLLEQTSGLQASTDAFSTFFDMFPSSKFKASAMNIYADKLERNGDIEKSKSVLQEIILLFPESPYANSAKTMLENDLVGLTAEEQLEKVLKANSTN